MTNATIRFFGLVAWLIPIACALAETPLRASSAPNASEPEKAADNRPAIAAQRVSDLLKKQGDHYFGTVLLPEEYEYLARAERELPESLYYLRGRTKNGAPPTEQQIKHFTEFSRERFAFEDPRIYPYSVKTLGALVRRQREPNREPLSPDELAYLRWALGGPRTELPMKPLTEMSADDRYKGEDGGLYGSGKNDPPETLHAAAMARLRMIRPLDAQGRPSAEGKIVLLSIGMSNASEAFRCFKSFADQDPTKSKQVVIIDGAQPSQLVTSFIKDGKYSWGPPGSAARSAWEVIDERLKAAGVTLAQVQVVWVKLALCPNSSEPFDKTFELNTRPYQRQLAELVQVLHRRCSNLQVVFLSTRIFGGYAQNALHPEPFAYETGFAIRWLIQEQMRGKPDLNWDSVRGEVKAPLLLWGPYLWAAGATPRQADGLCWLPEDVRDGTHKTYMGILKTKDQLLKFFKSSPYAKGWFTGK